MKQQLFELQVLRQTGKGLKKKNLQYELFKMMALNRSLNYGANALSNFL